MPHPEVHIGEVTLSLDEAEEVLTAIRHGLVDAVVVEEGEGEQVFTFRDPSHPYRVLIEAMTDGAALVTFDGLICYHNPHLATMLQLGDTSLGGQLLSELVVPEHRMLVDAALHDARSGIARLEVKLLGGGDRRVPVQLSLSAATLADIPVCCVVATDLTEHNRQEEQFRRARIEIEARDRLVSVAAHELRTPLSVLVLQSERLRRMIPQAGGPDALPEGADRVVLSIETQCRQLATMIDKLLDLGSISHGGLQLDIADCDLVEIVREVQLAVEPRLRDSGARLELDLQPARGRWDHARLVQVVNNLLTNAIKYGHGTPIRVAVGSDGHVARLVVQDGGPGIPISERERVFRPYERAAAGAGAVHGLGLGLYITAEIVKAHAGTIRIEGEEGHGARFVVELPVARPGVR